MNLKRIFAGLVFLDFAAFTLWIVFTQDNLALIRENLTNPWGLQVALDLCFSAMFGSMWLYRDAKKKGINPWPWLAAVLPTGSLSLLAYATVHGFAKDKTEERRAGTALAA
ncbi:MAG: hypothetical protein AB7S26_22600 [Sandaracinaceae bacterium]